MYDSILVPLDGSATSEHALPVAQSLAQQARAPLHLLHVYRPSSAEPLYVPGLPVIDAEGHLRARDHPQTYLDQVSARLQQEWNGTVTCGVRDVDGTVTKTILDYAETTHTRLIVLTTHGRSGFERLWLGSVADALARSSAIPLIVIPSSIPVPSITAHATAKHLVIPLDGSSLAEGVIEHARELGTLSAASYTLLRVVVPVRLHENSAFFTPVDVDAAWTERERVEAQQYLDAMSRELDPTGTRVRTLVVVAAHPAVEIVNVAKRTGAWIAMATHGRSGLQRFLLGSVADKILRSAETPIFLCPPRTTEEDGRD